jgi:NAD(P)-dependent dehydrogenase (short-subunit alcohol dehydrogenase family)
VARKWGDMTIEISLDGSVALVTGSGAGIGREIARWLARAGAAVAVNDINGERAEETVALIGAEGGRAAAVVADVRQPDLAAGLSQRVIDAFGRLDIAVNNVGMTAGRVARPFLESSAQDAGAIVEQNLLATYQCCLSEAKSLVAQGDGGCIINVSSGETTRPSLGLSSYGASKAGINHLTMTLAAELGPHGIRVNAMAPGTTFTEEIRAVIGAEQFAAISASTPLQRVTEPEELGRLAVFLASDLSRCITGQLILADAGAHLGRRPLSVPGLSAPTGDGAGTPGPAPR